MHLVVARPEPEARAMAMTLQAAGHQTIVEPMLVIEPVREAILPLDGVAALVATSVNALRAIAGRPEVPALLSLPIYMVGPATAAAARQLGFAAVIEGGGSAAALLPVLIARVPRGTRLLHLAGDIVAVDLATPLSQAGIGLETVIVYKSSERRALSPALVAALRQGEVDGIILMSPRTARVFASLVTQAGLAKDARRVVCFCISQSTASALAGLALPSIRISERPDLPSLLALIDCESAQLPERA
jgi:uroporphyrinogen-III synthase